VEQALNARKVTAISLRIRSHVLNEWNRTGRCVYNMTDGQGTVWGAVRATPC
jgi:hypothetical protein